MGHRFFIAGLVVTSALWVSVLEAGKPAPRPPAPHVSPPRAPAPHPQARPAPHPNVARPNIPHPQNNVAHPNLGHPNVAHPNVAHTNAAHTNTIVAHAHGAAASAQLLASLHRQSMKGSQKVPGMAVLRAKAHASHMHDRLRHMAHWHHWHWWHHHVWGVGVYGLLPAFNSNIVTSVPTGNTLNVSGIGQPVRLAGVGTPFDGQGFASSRDTLEGIANGQQVKVFSVGMDPSGATVAQVFLNDGSYLNERQIRTGTAWYSADDWPDPVLGAAEEQAQMSGSGLWSGGGDYASNF